jgi:hypothetical protein
MAEVAAPRQMFQEILMLIAQLRALPAPHEGMGLEFDRQRRQKCALIKAKPPVPARCGRAERLAILAATGSAAIEFRCGAPQ